MDKAWDIIAKLNEISRIEGTEIGETLSSLVSLYESPSELSDEFYIALDKEIRRWGKWAEKVKVVKKTEMVQKTWYDIQETWYEIEIEGE